MTFSVRDSLENGSIVIDFDDCVRLIKLESKFERNSREINCNRSDFQGKIIEMIQLSLTMRTVEMQVWESWLFVKLLD